MVAARTLVLALVWLLFAFQFPLKMTTRPDLRVDVPLVLIPAHVSTPLGTPVNSLTRENFRLFEDGVEQKITHFANEDAPVSIGLLFDTSGSMRDKIRKSLEAVSELFKNANSEDEFFLIEFNERPKLIVPFTPKSEDVYQRLQRTKPVGRTSLLDAIHLGLLQMKGAPHARKAMVILSDGGDNHSRYTASEINAALKEADIQVYAMGIFKSEELAKRPREERSGPRLLDDLTEQTGGRHFPVESLDDLPAACSRIGAALRNQYLLGYSPPNPVRDGKYHHVKVVLEAPDNMPRLKVYHRQGYYGTP
jgi:VWFA-related protein